MSGMARSLFVSFLIALTGFFALGVWSYYDSSRFDVGEARITLTAVKSKLASIFSLNSASDQPVPILMYHYVRDNVDQDNDQLGYNLSVPPAEFEAQLKTLKKNGWHTVSLQDVADGKYDDKSVVLTFDDGYKDFILEAYPLLERYNFTATIFVIANNIDAAVFLSEDDIIYLANRGFEIGSHSESHANLTNSSNAQLTSELKDSKQTLEGLTGKSVTVFSYPAGQYNNHVVEAVEYYGYEAAVTTESALAIPKSGLYTLSRKRVKRDLNEDDLLWILNH